MVTSLVDPITATELSRAVESNAPYAMGRFIDSLALSADEAASIIGSLETLPHLGLAEAELPSEPPTMTAAHWWDA